jgi:hypothetical protein
MSKSLNKAPQSLFAIFRSAVIVTLVIIVSPAPSSLQTIPPPLVASPPPRHHPLPPDFVEPQPVANTPFESPENVLAAPSVPSGTWTVLAKRPSASFWPNGAFLLTDGRVLVQDGNLTNVAWWTLTPDNSGSYVKGTWSQIASPPSCPNGYPTAGSDTVYSPLYYASAVLPDGRFVVIGGEYNYNYDYFYNNGSREIWTDQGAIYDPVANSWTCITAPPGWTQIGDAQSVVLNDGTFLMGNPFDNEVATIDFSPNPPTFNAPFTPLGKTADFRNAEEGWTLSANGTVLTTENWNSGDNVNTPALIYIPSQQSWSSVGTAPDPLVLIKSGNANYFEVGPSVLRPDGTVFAAGATGFNDIYNTNTHSWTSGPPFPKITDTYSQCVTTASGGAIEQLAPVDAPAALLPDGNVLIAVSPVDSVCGWIPPTQLFEFDGTNLAQVNAPTFAQDDVSYRGRMLVLPTGQILWTDLNDAEVYTPSGSANSSWAPMITSSPPSVKPGGTNYQLTGTQLNGLSQAVGYGDDYQAATNYPLVRITNNTTNHVFYARTHDHSTMAVATGNISVSTEFDVASGTEPGSSTLVVVANGIASQPVNVDVTSATKVSAAVGLSKGFLNFGTVRVGRSKRKVVALINTANKEGGATITFNGISLSGSSEFSAAGCNGQIGPKGRCSVTVGFAPSAPGAASATITINGNASNNPQTIGVAGTGR